MTYRKSFCAFGNRAANVSGACLIRTKFSSSNLARWPTEMLTPTISVNLSLSGIRMVLSSLRNIAVICGHECDQSGGTGSFAREIPSREGQKAPAFGVGLSGLAEPTPAPLQWRGLADS